MGILARLGVMFVESGIFGAYPYIAILVGGDIMNDITP